MRPSANQAGRRALLETACSGDPELRREVEALLAADGRSSEFALDQPLSATGSEARTASLTDRAPRSRSATRPPAVKASSASSRGAE